MGSVNRMFLTHKPRRHLTTTSVCLGTVEVSKKGCSKNDFVKFFDDFYCMSRNNCSVSALLFTDEPLEVVLQHLGRCLLVIQRHIGCQSVQDHSSPKSDSPVFLLAVAIILSTFRGPPRPNFLARRPARLSHRPWARR